MKEKAEELFEKTRTITAAYLIYQDRDNLEKIRELIPQIQEFAVRFLQENEFGLDQELYQEMGQNLVLILKDILSALEQQDRVLMHDAIAYGLMEYLELYSENKQEAQNDNL